MNARGLQEELLAVATAARSFELTRFDSETDLSGPREMASEVVDLLEQSSLLLQTIETQCLGKEGGKPTAPFRHLADLCFVVETDVRRCRDQLRHLGEDVDAWGVVARIEHAIERLARGSCAVEVDLAQAARRISLSRHIRFLDEELEVRRAVIKFSRAIAAADEPESPIEKRLRSAGTISSRLTGRDCFRNLGLVERRTARELLRRIKDWILEGRDVEEGERLWQDVLSYSVLLSDINESAELKRHDLNLINEAVEALVNEEPHGPVPVAVAQRLDGGFGRDEALDDLLVAAEDVATILARLLLVLDRLQGPSRIEIPPSVNAFAQ